MKDRMGQDQHAENTGKDTQKKVAKAGEDGVPVGMFCEFRTQPPRRKIQNDFKEQLDDQFKKKLCKSRKQRSEKFFHQAGPSTGVAAIILDQDFKDMT